MPECGSARVERAHVHLYARVRTHCDQKIWWICHPYSLCVVLCRYAVDFCYIVNIILFLGCCCSCLCVGAFFPLLFCTRLLLLVSWIYASCIVTYVCLWTFREKKGYVNTHTRTRPHSRKKDGNDSGFCEREISNTRNRPTKWQAKEIMSTKIGGEII